MRKLLSWKRVLLALLIIVIVAVTGFVAWANNALQPTPEALTALQTDAQVTVSETNGWYVFTPTMNEPTTGLIFYPGGKVDARAYAPQMHAIASAGYLTLITPMPLNLAVFGVNKADEVIKAYPDIEHWAIAGHSLGGSMAAQFASTNSSIRGLAFWASYPAVDLSKSSLKVISIYGTNDGVAAQANVIGGKPSLPTDAVFAPIEGGNHSGFGWYGLQPGDNEPTISHEEQSNQTVQLMVDFLASISQ